VAISSQTSVAHVEDCTEWRYRDDRYGAVNHSKDSSSIQFMLTKDLHVIEGEVKSAIMKQVRAVIIVFSATLALSALPWVANALSFSTPSDPVSPTSIAHCNDLYQQYSEITAQLRAQAKQCGDQAWEVLNAAGIWEAKPYYQKCDLIHDEHSAVLSQGNRARLRCTQKVYAYKRRLRQQQQLSRKLAINIGKEVADHLSIEAGGLPVI
jgi:hypothetical protein